MNHAQPWHRNRNRNRWTRLEKKIALTRPGIDSRIVVFATRRQALTGSDSVRLCSAAASLRRDPELVTTTRRPGQLVPQLIFEGVELPAVDARVATKTDGSQAGNIEQCTDVGDDIVYQVEATELA